MGMSFKRLKKKAKGIMGKNPIKGFFGSGKKDSGGGDGYRSEAAKKSIVGVNRQGGSGQVKFNTEVYG